MIRLLIPLCIIGVLSACAESPPPREGAVLKLLQGDQLESFAVVDKMQDHGPVTFQDGVLRLGAGQPMTGVVYKGDTSLLPVKDYEISYEARRVSGSDFFAALTFPVRDLKTCATFVLGGWGGQCVGISCLNYMSADENETTNWFEFEESRWYRIRLQVREDHLKGFIDDKVVFDVSTEDKKISMRFGDIELCQPLGLASYLTVGEVRELQIRPLAAAPVQEP